VPVLTCETCWNSTLSVSRGGRAAAQGRNDVCQARRWRTSQNREKYMNEKADVQIEYEPIIAHEPL
jgi:hypothetical protein